MCPLRGSYKSMKNKIQAQHPNPNLDSALLTLIPPFQNENRNGCVVSSALRRRGEVPVMVSSATAMRSVALFFGWATSVLRDPGIPGAVFTPCRKTKQSTVVERFSGTYLLPNPPAVRRTGKGGTLGVLWIPCTLASKLGATLTMFFKLEPNSRSWVQIQLRYYNVDPTWKFGA